MGKKKKHKSRDPVAYDLLTNGLYKLKVESNKKNKTEMKYKKGYEEI